jgi:hypothetical protein
MWYLTADDSRYRALSPMWHVAAFKRLPALRSYNFPFPLFGVLGGNDVYKRISRYNNGEYGVMYGYRSVGESMQKAM